MGRKIPIGENPSLLHPVLSLSLFVVCIAATVSIFSSLCGGLSRKKSRPRALHDKTTENDNVVNSQINEEAMTMPAEGSNETTRDMLINSTNMMMREGEEQQEQLPLPPPPGMLRGAASCHFRSSSTTSVGKLSSSLSMRVSGGGGMGSRLTSRREEKLEKEKRKKDKNLKHEDSIWKKQIILGEKCKVPDEDDDAVLYDEFGNRISTYHPKTAASVPVSRQTSYIDQDAIPTSQGLERR